MRYKTATITVYNDDFGIEKEKNFVGTEEEIVIEAMDWENEIALKIIESNAIESEEEQELIIENTGHIITWKDESTLEGYSVSRHSDCSGNIIGIFLTREEAEEAAFHEALTLAHNIIEISKTEAAEALGDLDKYFDCNIIAEEIANTFKIQKVSIFGVY